MSAFSEISRKQETNLIGRLQKNFLLNEPHAVWRFLSSNMAIMQTAKSYVTSLIITLKMVKIY